MINKTCKVKFEDFANTDEEFLKFYFYWELFHAFRTRYFYGFRRGGEAAAPKN